mmetsp:Transcript_137850/g.326609  ORF Transcript_137850/g.326609 Transcript_137850/m.326609 type:complete len:492 (+) Transcript_137850:83-1558(+)
MFSHPEVNVPAGVAGLGQARGPAGRQKVALELGEVDATGGGHIRCSSHDGRIVLHQAFEDLRRIDPAGLLLEAQGAIRLETLEGRWCYLLLPHLCMVQQGTQVGIQDLHLLSEVFIQILAPIVREVLAVHTVLQVLDQVGLRLTEGSAVLADHAVPCAGHLVPLVPTLTELPFDLRRHEELGKHLLPDAGHLRLHHLRYFFVDRLAALAKAVRREVLCANLLQVCELPAVGLALALHVWTRPRADGGPHHNDARLLRLGLGLLHGLLKNPGVVGVSIRQLDHVPAFSCKNGGRVLAKGQIRAAVDGDFVVIVEDDEFAQLQVACQGCGLLADAFHETSVTGQHIGVVVKQRKAFLVEPRSQVSFSDGHAYGVGEALAQRASGDLHAAGHTELRVPRRAAACLAKLLETLHGHYILPSETVAREVQHHVEQRARMAHRQHKAVPVQPPLERREMHDLAPERVGQGRTAEGRAQVPGRRLVHHVGCKQPDGVD